MRSTSGVEGVKATIAAANESISNDLIQNRSDLDPQVAKQPVQVQENVVIGDRQAQVSLQAVDAYISQQTFFIPLILFIVITFASQLVATSIASEKENKTLETLLSAPVNRQTIVAAKLLAAALLALLFAVVYMVGFRSYFGAITGGELSQSTQALPELTSLGLTFTPASFAILGATLFLGILIALAMAVILGAFAEDVKGIQAVMAPLLVMLAIPYLLVTFFDVSSLSPVFKWLIYAIPFSHSFLAPQALILEQYNFIVAGAAYQLIVLTTLIIIAGRIFSTDAILTMKLNFKPGLLNRRK